MWAAGETATTDPTNLWGFLAATVTALLGVVAAGRAYVSKHRPDDDPAAPPRSERGVVRQQITTVESEAQTKYEERLLGEIRELRQRVTDLERRLAETEEVAEDARRQKHDYRTQLMILEEQLRQARQAANESYRPRPGARRE